MIESVVFAVILIIIAYVCGSLPFGLWVGRKVKGPDFDIRKHGSHNIGATNVLRVLGKGPALIVFLLDFFKGYLPVLAATMLVGDGVGILCLIASGFGHAKSVILRITEGKFQGGKSVATYFGGIVALQPAIAGIAFGVFLLVVMITRFVSVGSMLAITVAFALTFAFGLNVYWQIAFGLIMIMFYYNHRQNIGRLISGVEPKFNEKKPDAITAFVAHPVTLADYKQSPLTSWINVLLDNHLLNEKQAKRLILKICRSMEVDEITGIKNALGQTAKVILYSIPLLPEQILKPEIPENCSNDERELIEITNIRRVDLITTLLRKIAVDAERRGVTVLGLGALLSVFAEGGSTLQAWAKAEGLKITIDNGAAFTAAATIKALREVSPKPLNELIVANIGASGFIGNVIIRYLRTLVKELIATARSREKIASLEDFAELLTTETLSKIKRADVVICNTSSEKPIINEANCRDLLNPVVKVMDVAVPPDFDDKVLKIMKGVALVRCGLILLPGDPKMKIDFHFGISCDKNGVEHYNVPACLAQGLVLAWSGQYQHASRAIVREDAVKFFEQKAEEYGIEVIVSQVCEGAVFGKVSQ